MPETSPPIGLQTSVLVTGAHGFVGQRLMHTLGMHAEALSTRSAPASWSAALAQKQCVVHLGARVHVMHDAASDPLTEYRKANVEVTRELARQAASCGVKRFIFISSIKVNGEETTPGHPFRATDTPAPQDPYGISKLEAEQGLRSIAQETGMEVVIIRPPLVYGPGVKANFATMVTWLQRGVPLPLGAIDNRRSLVALDNLVDLIITCIDHPAAANQTFLVSDGEDVSTTELLRRMGSALGKPARLLPVPPIALEWCARCIGKKEFAQRVSSSLQIDMGHTHHLLAWQPPVSMELVLHQIAQYFKSCK